MLIHLGVVEIPYAETNQETGDVAQILEDKFGVMGIFAEQNEKKIAGYIENGLQGAIENALAGAPESADPFGSAMADIEDRFQGYIDGAEHGIVLKKQSAPKKGARFKRQYRKATSSLAFYETGLYRNSFKAWVD
jgi:hypothetical protein